MFAIFHIFKRLAVQLRGENLHRVIAMVVILIVVGSAAFSFFEKDLGFWDALWWSIVTVTTVGYGDISPATLGGRVVGVILMLMGIGFLGLLTATIATVFIEEKLMEDRGFKATDTEGHYIICGWHLGAETIVNELRQDEKSKDLDLVIVADLEMKPIKDRKVHFIRGEINEETLERAGAGRALGAVMLADWNLDPGVRDARTILDTLTFKSLYPDTYVCVELMESKNLNHCRLAKADEIIVVGALSTYLLAQATLDHGITQVVSELVSRSGQDLYHIDLPVRLVGKTYFDAMCELKRDNNINCLGVETREKKHLITNPDGGFLLSKGDRLVVIAEDRPNLG